MRSGDFRIVRDPVKYRRIQADLPDLAGRLSGRRRRNVSVAGHTLLTDSTKTEEATSEPSRRVRKYECAVWGQCKSIEMA